MGWVRGFDEIMCVKYLAQSVAQARGPHTRAIMTTAVISITLGMALACIPSARKSAWEPTALRSRRHRAHEAQTGLGGVCEPLGAPGELPSCCAWAVWGGDLWLSQQFIGCLGAGWDVFDINVVGPATPTERCRVKKQGCAQWPYPRKYPNQRRPCLPHETT